MIRNSLRPFLVQASLVLALGLIPEGPAPVRPEASTRPAVARPGRTRLAPAARLAAPHVDPGLPGADDGSVVLPVRETPRPPPPALRDPQPGDWSQGVQVDPDVVGALITPVRQRPIGAI